MKLSRRVLLHPEVILALVVSVLTVLSVVAWWNTSTEEDEADRRVAQAEHDLAARLARQREESSSLMPDVLEGVALGMELPEVRGLGHHVEPAAPRPPVPGAPVLVFYEERLPTGGQIMFGFSEQTGRLVQVQVMSLLPTTGAIPLHLQAMNERYGTPSGIWDCPDTQGLPTRRFTWRQSQTAIADVFLIYGDRVSLTLYIATPETIENSLRLARCAPTSPEHVEQFPAASPEQIQQATAEGE